MCTDIPEVRSEYLPCSRERPCSRGSGGSWEGHPARKESCDEFGWHARRGNQRNAREASAVGRHFANRFEWRRHGRNS